MAPLSKRSRVQGTRMRSSGMVKMVASVIATLKILTLPVARAIPPMRMVGNIRRSTRPPAASTAPAGAKSAPNSRVTSSPSDHHDADTDGDGEDHRRAQGSGQQLGCGGGALLVHLRQRWEAQRRDDGVRQEEQRAHERRGDRIPADLCLRGHER